MPRPSHLLLVVLVLYLARASWAARSCINESICNCQSIGGKWLQPPNAPQPTCRWFMRYQGRQRYADVFLPANYTRSSSYPLWTMLHGLHWTGWWSSNVKLNRPVRGGEAFAHATGLSTGPLRNQAIMVFPDAAGDPTRRQFWNSRFWPCAQGVCLDPTIDDLGFLEQLMERLVALLPVNKQQVFMSGYSNGGMMLQTALCSSPRLMRLVKAVALAKSSINQRFLSEDCPAAVGVRMPLLLLGDTGDRTFSYAKDAQVMGTPMYSTENWAGAWAGKRACGFPDVPGAVEAAQEDRKRFHCQDACCSSGLAPTNISAAVSRVASSKARAQVAGGAPPLMRYCALVGGSHQWNTPERGLENQLIWRFFQEATQPNLPRSTAPTQCPLPAKPNTAATAKPLPRSPAPVVTAPPSDEVTPVTGATPPVTEEVTTPAVPAPVAVAPAAPVGPTTQPAAPSSRPARGAPFGRWDPRNGRGAVPGRREEATPAAAGQGPLPSGPGAGHEGEGSEQGSAASSQEGAAPTGEHSSPAIHSLTSWLSQVLP